MDRIKILNFMIIKDSKEPSNYPRLFIRKGQLSYSLSNRTLMQPKVESTLEMN